jgi:hypothetical protein
MKWPTTPQTSAHRKQSTRCYAIALCATETPRIPELASDLTSWQPTELKSFEEEPNDAGGAGSAKKRSSHNES